MALRLQKKLWTADEFNRMAEAGVLDSERRLELVEGEIYLLSPQNRAHGLIISHLNQLLVAEFASTHYVRVQLPLSLEEHSEPEPDFALCTKEATLSAARHPSSADLVLEVADSSLSFDREQKARVYARAGIPNYVVVNVSERCLEVFQKPKADRFETTYVLRGDEETRFDGLEFRLNANKVFAILENS